MRVLITGGSGALGRALVENLMHDDRVERVAIYSRDEHKHNVLAKQWSVNLRGDGSKLRFFIGDVRDRDRLRMAMRGITHVIHAAALKVVPSGEYNPTEFVNTNIIGAQNVMQVAIESGVEVVVGVSTDKACGPVNLYGATKLAAEKVFLAGNAYGGGTTRFSVCRYGNVSGSTGSVIPIWSKLAAEGKPLPITDPGMTRFWMTLEDAVRFVLWVMEHAYGGEVFVPVLPSYYLDDLAQAVWDEHCGVRNTVAELQTIGIRPGEKMHESMVSEDESQWCYLKEDLSMYAISQWAKPQGLWLPVEPGFSYRSDVNSADEMSVTELREAVRALGL